MMPSEIKLPKLKENVDSVEVSEVLVAPGQTVQKDQPLLVVNADKSNMEVYAPMAGKVVKLNVQVGDEIKIGSVYAVLEGSNGEAAAPPTPAAKASAAQVRKDEKTDEPTPREVKAIRAEVALRPTPARTTPVETHTGVVPASPATRWLARKLGVDLRGVRGSGPKGRVTEDDVKAAYGGDGGAPVVLNGPATQLPALPNFEQFGPVERETLTRVRKLTAQKMSMSWTLIPHVTQHDAADVTDLEAFRKENESRMPMLNGKPIKLTALAFILKACVAALKQFPTFNSTLDLAGNQLILKKHYHLGIAVDTKGGLLVPVIRDVDKKGIEQLAQELAETGEKARNGKADMNGGTFTITNLGGIGGTGFTPIINYPEVAILGLSRNRMQPVVKDGAVVPRLMLPLSLSYDHRVIDGADAARFVRAIAEMLEEPWMLLMRSG